jgi:transcriptional antiterminator Rof (Rho-off)
MSFLRKLDFSNKIKKILKKYGDEKIVAIRVGRRPISSMVEKAFNLISLGKWKKLRKKYYYDKLFHLFLIITLEDGTKLSFEKNDIVNMEENDSRCSQKNVDCIELEYEQNSISVNDLVKKPLDRIGKKDYFIYDPFKLNCQIFIKSILETFGLYDNNTKNFVYQDIRDIVKELPFYVKWSGKAVTDTTAFAKKISGAGHNKEDIEAITKFILEEIVNQK